MSVLFILLFCKLWVSSKPSKDDQAQEDRTGDSEYTFQQQCKLFKMQMALEQEKPKLSEEAAKQTEGTQCKDITNAIRATKAINWP